MGLLPFFLSLHWWRPDGAERATDEPAGGGAAWQRGDTAAGAGECGGWRPGRVSTRCSAALHRLFCPRPRSSRSGHGLLAGYLLCLYVWGGCKLAAGLG